MTKYELPSPYTQPVSRDEDGMWHATVDGPQGQRRLVQDEDYETLLGLVVTELGELYDVDDPALLDVQLEIDSVPGIPNVRVAAESVVALWGDSKDLREVIRGNHGTAVSLRAEHVRKWRETVSRANGIAFKLSATLYLAGVLEEDIARLLDIGVSQVPWFAGPHETNRQRHELLDGTTI